VVTAVVAVPSVVLLFDVVVVIVVGVDGDGDAEDVRCDELVVEMMVMNVENVGFEVLESESLSVGRKISV
jgi:hypothetical protein